MTLDEAITHAEDVAKNKISLAKGMTMQAGILAVITMT